MLITIKTSDNVLFPNLDYQQFKCSKTISDTVEIFSQDVEGPMLIPLDNISSSRFQVILEWIQRTATEKIAASTSANTSNDANINGVDGNNADNNNNDDDDDDDDVGDDDIKSIITPISTWERTLFEDVSLVEVLADANFLEIKELSNVVCQLLADEISSMSIEEVRRVFNIKNDFSPEEEEQIRKENSWCMGELQYKFNE